MDNERNNGIKIVLLFIIIVLIVLAILGTIYYFSQSNAKIMYIRAQEKFKLGTTEDIRSGIQLFRLLVEKFPQSPLVKDALLQIGYGYELIYKKTKDEAKLNIAEQEYEHIIHNFPDSLEAQKAMFQIAQISYLRGNYDEAREKLDYILSRYIDTPLKARIYTEKGYASMALGEYTKALQFFNQKENVNDDMALMGKAECYFKMNEFDKGLNIYEDLIMYRKTSNYRKTAINKFLNMAYSYAQKLAKEKEYQSSNMLYEKIVTLFPDQSLSENALYWLGENYYDQKNFEKSIEYFLKTLNNKFTHKDDSALFKLGISYFEKGQYGEALKFFQRLVDQFQKSPFRNMAMDWQRQTLREIKYRQ